MNKSKALVVLAFPLTLGLIIISCTKDVGVIPVEPPSFCDTITYEKHIKPIIDNHCISCHGDISPSSGYPLTSYDLLKQKGVEGKIKDRVIIKKDMPPAPDKLSNEELNMMNCWITNGYK